MAECRPAQNHPSKEGKTTIDTTLPYNSVKGAVSIFDPKARGVQMRNGCDAGLHSLSFKKSSMLSNSGHPSESQTVDTASSSMEPDIDVAKQKITTEQHMSVLAELGATRKELEKVQQELLLAQRDKVAALKQAEEASTVAEFNAKRVEELSKEILGANESLQLVKLACVEANRDRDALLAAVRTEGERDLEASKETESPCLQTIVFKKLQEELDCTRNELANMSEKEANARAAIALLTVELDKVRAELRAIQLRANEAHMGLSQILEDATDEAKMSKEEALKVNIDSELAQAELRAILKEAEMEAESCDVQLPKLSTNRVDVDEELQQSRTNLSEAHAMQPSDMTDVLKGASRGACFLATRSFDRQKSSSEARQHDTIARVLSNKMPYDGQNLADGEFSQKIKKKKKPLLLGSVIGFLGKNKKVS